MRFEIEHHKHFTAVYIESRLALMFHEGTLEQRQAVPDTTWYTMATVASPSD